MRVYDANLPGLLIFEPEVFEDRRGYFIEVWNAKRYMKYGLTDKFVQDNLSFSHKGVLRGLHYQLAPKAQGKLVSVVYGMVFDVVVDIRRESPTFGQWFGAELSADNGKQLWIPIGFAHGFLALSEVAIVSYKVTEYYSPSHERCIRWDDPQLDIRWPVGITPILSSKDMRGAPFASVEVF